MLSKYRKCHNDFKETVSVRRWEWRDEVRCGRGVDLKRLQFQCGGVAIWNGNSPSQTIPKRTVSHNQKKKNFFLPRILHTATVADANQNSDVGFSLYQFHNYMPVVIGKNLPICIWNEISFILPAFILNFCSSSSLRCIQSLKRFINYGRCRNEQSCEGSTLNFAVV